MSVLEEFWYGNLDPAEYDASPSEEYKEFIRLISRNEEKLVATMTDEQKEIFQKFHDCWSEYASLSDEALFEYAFRLGAQLALELARDE